MGIHPSRWLCTALVALALLGPTGRVASADPLYTITDLGTPPGTRQSVATGINASGRVAGVSYTSSDGTWRSGIVLGAALPPFYDAQAQSFVQQRPYASGQSGGRTRQCHQRL